MDPKEQQNSEFAMGSRKEQGPRSEREQLGLRGPVAICTEETVRPNTTAFDNPQKPERRSWCRTEFSRAGLLICRSNGNPDGSVWTTRYTYNSSGLLLKIAWGKEGDEPGETVNRYDALGRLQSTTSTQTAHDSATFSYDSAGRKTKVQVSRPEDYVPNCSAGGSPFSIADRAPNLPGGGKATTIYDDHDRAAEVHVCDARGEHVMSAVRIYDERGRVVEEKQVLDDSAALIPADLRARILNASGANIEDLREQLATVFGRHSAVHSIVYGYDLHGHVVRTVQRVSNYEQRTETEYNEHGDPTRQVTRGREIDGTEANQAEYSEVVHSYQYDLNGNWTERIDSRRSTPDGVYETSSKKLRTLTYF